MNQEKIGKFILEARTNKKLTQAELAEKLGVTDRSVSNWENGKNMPDLSLFKPLCEILDISINELLSGEKIKEKDYQEKLEENIMNTIDYSNKKINKKNKTIYETFIFFGFGFTFTAFSIFPSESSWGGIYSVLGVMISLIGFNGLNKGKGYIKRLLLNLGYFVLIMAVLLLLDYSNVKLNNDVPRFSLVKVFSSENIWYYDTPFYDVIRCNVNEENETFKVIKNQKYNTNNINNFCK